MKKFKIYNKTGILLTILLCIALYACIEDFDSISSNPSDAYQTKVENIRMYVGATEPYTGKTNEKTKQIHFKFLDLSGQDTAAVLSSVRFEGDFPRGARFEYDSYDFTFPEGEAELTKTIAVVNEGRKREYFVTLRLRMPPPGADISKATAYDFGSYIPPAPFPPGCRLADIDMEHVFVGNRERPHLLRIEDLKNNKIEPIELNREGMTDGLVAGAVNNGGGIQNGHVYCSSWGNPFKVYHWRTDQPDQKPDIVASVAASTFENPAVSRLGDQVSFNIADNGRGYVYASGRIGADNVLHALRVSVTGWTNSSASALIALMNADGSQAGFAGQSGSSNYWPTFNATDDEPSEVLYACNYAEIKIMDSDMKVAYRFTGLPLADGGSARIIHFNGVRYLACLNGGGSSNAAPPGIIALYNIRNGETTQEALELFAENPTPPVYTHSVGGGNGDNSAYLGFAKDDNTLYLIGSGGGGGFAFVEIPRPAAVDPNDTSDPFFDELGADYIITNIIINP